MRELSRLIAVVLLLCSISYSFAQNRDVECKITGVLLEHETEKAVEYATIVLYSAKDSSLVDGVVSQIGGVFEFNKCPKDEYYIVVSFMGYEDFISDNFLLAHNLDMGKIFIKTSTLKIDEVVVSASLPQMSYRADKKIINTRGMLLSASMTAVDILENAPSVKTDIEGNVTIRGSSAFSVLINGKPSVLAANDVLQQIPATSIANIEIITNPTAKYEPDGTGGIINIVTKKNHSLGLQALLNASYGSMNSYGGDITLNYNLNKVNLYARADITRANTLTQLSTERHTITDGRENKSKSNGDSHRTKEKQDYRLGMNWDINPNNVFSIETNFGVSDTYGTINQLYEISNDNSDINKEHSLNLWNRNDTYISTVTTYQHNFADDKEHNLLFQGYFGYKDAADNSLSTLSKNDTVNSGSSTKELSPTNSINLKLDYTKPFKNSKLELGLQYRDGISRSEIIQSSFNPSSGDFEQNENLGKTSDYRHQIASLYGIYNGKYRSFSYILGLRTEWNKRFIGSINSDKDYNINRWDFFPTLHTSYRINDKNQLMASYSRRIDRPNDWYLEPFYTWDNMFNVSIGNPNLKPEFVDAFELSYVREANKYQFSLEGYYRIEHDEIVEYYQPYSEGVILTTYKNSGTSYSAGLEAMLLTNMAIVTKNSLNLKYWHCIEKTTHLSDEP